MLGRTGLQCLLSTTTSATASARAAGATHAVANQALPLQDFNAFLGDPLLIDAVQEFEGEWAGKDLAHFGAHTGSARHLEAARQANEYSPVLKAFDRFGHRIDEVEFHPSYHQVLGDGLRAGQSAYAWVHEGKPGAQVARGVMEMLGFASEAGTACPMSMTFACVPALRHDAKLSKTWVPKLMSMQYTPGLDALQNKAGATMGMSMTEKQGGSDVRANTTVATKLSDDRAYSLVGHKWFTSAPMCDAFLTLAQTGEGLSCFLVPRVLPDGTRNTFLIQRLKTKVGDRSNASSEVEYRNTYAELCGVEGRGIQTIIEMVTHTRLSCILGSAGLMRRSLQEAVHHTRHRRAFGVVLADAPIMKGVLADLALETEGAVAMALWLARHYDLAPSGGDFGRIATAITKYWTCKRAPNMVYEAMECHGGNGYVDDGPMGRNYRQAPLNSIWEGSGNVICLDIMRALSREPQTAAALGAVFESTKRSVGSSITGLAPFLDELLLDLGNPKERITQWTVRDFADRCGLALQAVALTQIPRVPAEAFVRSRMDKGNAHTYGSPKVGENDMDALIQRATVLS